MGERRASGEQKYDLSNLPPDTTLKQLASTIKARWVCEQAHQQLKEELGLDHFEGRSWRGLVWGIWCQALNVDAVSFRSHILIHSSLVAVRCTTT